MTKPALGRGLGALLTGPSGPPKEPVPAPQPGASGEELPLSVPLNRIQPCPFQPRKDFSAEALRELADSIKEQGIVQPLIVRRRGENFELIAGERRWRAAQLAGLSAAPIVIREADDQQVLELALIENLQRENLNPVEEALGFAQLIEQFNLTQEEAAAKVSKSRAAVANSLRLLKLAPEVLEYLRAGRLSAGHAKVLLSLTHADEQIIAAQRVLKESLNVRQAEDLVARFQNRSSSTPSKGASPMSRDPHVAHLEQQLTERLGTKVGLRYRQGKGAIEIRFFNEDELERILQLLGVAPA